MAGNLTQQMKSARMARMGRDGVATMREKMFSRLNLENQNNPETNMAKVLTHQMKPCVSSKISWSNIESITVQY